MGAPSTAVDKKKENESSSSVVNDSNAAVNDKDKSKETTTAKTNDTVGKVSEGMMLSTYSSLVQQYLGVFMIDNATFLAERCVADYPGNAEAIYLLALCYYRSGSPKRCRQVLLNAPSSQTHTMPNNNNVGSGSIPPASRYLCARCCYDLKEYSRAEEVLLRDCRLKYQQQQRLSAGSRSGSSFPSMDEWILQTTVRVRYCRRRRHVLICPTKLTNFCLMSLWLLSLGSLVLFRMEQLDWLYLVRFAENQIAVNVP